jgi:hypothetical protein
VKVGERCWYIPLLDIEQIVPDITGQEALVSERRQVWEMKSIPSGNSDTEMTGGH